MARVIGITGGIATGKSTVLRMFADLGAQVISADDLAREVLAQGGAAYAPTVERFGEGILKQDGEIDRAALGEIIFTDPQARIDLNSLTHPHIIASMREVIERFRANHAANSVLAVEIPLLFECALDELVDEVVVVATEPQTQECRLINRSNISAEQARTRIAAQMPVERKVERADRVIWNDESIQSLEGAVRAVWDEIRLL